MRELLLVGLTSALVTFLATSIVRVLAVRWGAVAIPRERDVHAIPTPRLGGVGIYLGILVGAAVAWELPALTRGFDYGTPDMPAVLVSGSIILIVGIIDDRWGIDATTKLVGQVCAAGVLVLMGVSWSMVPWPFGPNGTSTTIFLDPLQSGLLTILIVVATANAINFIDGLDGLLIGVAFIASAAIALFSIGVLFEHGGAVSYYPPTVISVVLAGACLGFLPHNFHPARIFMGDSGALLIGLMLAATSTSASGRVFTGGYGGVADAVTLLAPLLLAMAVIAVPMLDMLLAIVRRSLKGVNPFNTADRLHLHHRLLYLGHSHCRAVLLIYLWVGVLALAAAAQSFVTPEIVLPFMLGGIVVAIVATIAPRLRLAMSGGRRASGENAPLACSPGAQDFQSTGSEGTVHQPDKAIDGVLTHASSISPEVPSAPPNKLDR